MVIFCLKYSDLITLLPIIESFSCVSWLKKLATVKYSFVSLNCWDTSAAEGLRVLNIGIFYSCTRFCNFNCESCLKTSLILKVSLRSAKLDTNFLNISCHYGLQPFLWISNCAFSKTRQILKTPPIFNSSGFGGCHLKTYWAGFSVFTRLSDR